jgi:hypothetical protein
MKNIYNISKYFLIAVIAVATVASAAAQQMTQSAAKVVRIKGSARYATSANVWQPLKVGDVLNAGAIIQTAADSRVDLVLGEGSVDVGGTPTWGGSSALGGGGGGGAYQPVADQNFVRIWENSVMAIDKLQVADTGADQITETSLDVRSGRIFGTVKKLSAGSKYEIKIPNGVAGIRGTIFSISADGILSVMSGSVVVAYAGAGGNVATQMVTAGQTYDCRSGVVLSITDSEKKIFNDFVPDSRGGRHHGPPNPFPGNHNEGYCSPTQGGH